MALNASNLASEIESNMRSALSLGSTPYPQLTAFTQALASAIVSHISSNAQVSVSYLDSTHNNTTNLNFDQTRTASGTVS